MKFRGLAVAVAFVALLLPNPAAVSKFRFDLPEAPGSGPGFANTEGRVLKPCRAERQLVILIAGQSNGANYLGSDAPSYLASPAVVNFNVYDGQCYQAREPLLGAGGIHGSFADRLGDLIIKNGIADRVVLAPVAIGGTIAQDWHGILYPRIAVALEGLRRQGLKPDVILWQQGEAEAQTPNYSAERYQDDIHAITALIRAVGIDAPFYVAVSTTCQEQTKRNDKTIQRAQRTIEDETRMIRKGADTDQFGSEYRADGCHFSARGADVVAREWFKAVWGTRTLAERH